MPEFSVISRKDALRLGQARYFTGKPCKFGHVSDRQVSGKSCNECRRVSDRKKYAENPEKHKAKSSAHKKATRPRINELKRINYRADPSKVKAQNAKFREKNGDDLRFRSAKWREENPGLNAIYAKQWRQKYPDRQFLAQAKARAIRLAAEVSPPSGLEIEFRNDIRSFYKMARQMRDATGVVHCVDHIFPLARRGVHAPWNLQILTKLQNSQKHATVPTDMPKEVIWRGLVVSRIVATQKQEITS